MRERRGREQKEVREVLDECVFIPGEGPDWQIRSGSTAIPDTAGGEGVTGPLNRMA